MIYKRTVKMMMKETNIMAMKILTMMMVKTATVWVLQVVALMMMRICEVLREDWNFSTDKDFTTLRVKCMHTF